MKNMKQTQNIKDEKSPNKSGTANDATEGFMDPLLDCLVILTRINGNPLSAKSLIAGLPLVKYRLTPRLFVRAAARAGMTSRIVKRPIRKISKMILPAVLLLKNNKACILNKVFDDGTVEIILPDSGGGTSKISINDLAEEYIGYTIFLKPVYKFDKRADEFHVASKKSWFWGTLWEYRQIYFQVILAALLINLFALATPLFIMNVYDRVVPNFAVETLWVLAIGIGIVVSFDLFIRTLRGYLIDVAGKKADTILASILFHQAMNVQMAAKPVSTGAFANNLREFEILREFFTSATLTTLVDLPFIFIFIAIIWNIGGTIAVVPLLAIPVVLFAAFFFEIPVRIATENMSFCSNQKHAILMESLNGLETIKSFSAEGLMQSKWEQFVAVASDLGLKTRFFSTLAINFTVFVAQLITIAIVVYGVYLVNAGEITTGGLIACVILNGRAISPLTGLASIVTRFNQSRVALKNLNNIMNLPVERSPDKKYLHKPNFKESIEFYKVSFKYPGDDENEQYALKDINFKIMAGDKIAIIGAMGSGKSTIGKLMLDLYSPTEGSIFFDGIETTQIDPADLRHNISCVSQDYPLLYGNIQSNISLSIPWASDQAILYAAKLSCVDDFVSKHPAGYAMPIGEGGCGLSGGQRQSVAIARALLANAPILLLDEPTSSIDVENEKKLIRNITQFSKNKTLIIITHKVDLLSLVDRVIIVSNGRIGFDGKKDEILEKFKKYRENSNSKS